MCEPVPPHVVGPCHERRGTLASVPPTKLWFVRAGEGAAHVGEFLNEKHVAIGWPEVGTVTSGTTDEDLEAAFDKAYPDQKPGTRRVWLAMVRRFVRELKKGDGVMTYDPERRLYALGEIESDVEQRQHDLGRVRRVRWTHQVQRDVLSPGTRNSLGAIATLFQVIGEAREEVWAKATPFGAPTVEPTPVRVPVASEGEGGVLADTLAKAEGFIEDRLIQLSWDDVQELFAGILRAMGYRARVSPPGSDRGVDIFASPDGLGLQEPRIFVEVKHRKGKMDAPEIRSFLGGRKPGDRCLYVSTGGFTKEAQYEAERASVPIQLVNLERLRELLIEYYEQLPAQVSALVPLKKVYWPEGP
jgi:restriction system protein